MSSSVDSRIAELKFNNSQFESGIKDSLKSIDNLNKGLKLDGSTKGFQQISEAARGVNLGPIGDGVQAVTNKFSALGVMAITTLANITNRAVDFGINFAKSLTVAPISDGFAEYELKMGSIQTIMSGSGASLDVVNEKLGVLNEYADRTIYSFADMTNNIGKFTNAGVSLDMSVDAIQGIANVAAISGANSNEASRAMYNFSQALSKGYVQLIDWKSIELANMGTVEFKQQLIDSAVAAGTLTDAGDGMYKTLSGKLMNATKDFNDTLADQWMTTEVLTGTLSKYSDETTDIGKRAFAAAQDVKTFGQMVDTMKESVGSGWSETFEIIFGDFEEAKVLWTGINTAFDNWAGNAADIRNNLLQGWKDLGGRTNLIDALANAVRYLGEVISPIKDAFANIFPPITAKNLADITKQFLDFTKNLKVSDKDAQNIKRTFSGLFAIFGIVIEVVKGLAKGFGVLTDGAGGLVSKILEVTASVGDFFTNLLESIRSGDDLSDTFVKIGENIRKPIDWLIQFGATLKSALSKIDGGPVLDFFERLWNAIKAIKIPTLSEIGTAISDIFGSFSSLDASASMSDKFWNGVKTAFDKLKTGVPALIKELGSAFTGIGDALAEVFSGIDYDAVLSTIQTGLLGGFVVMLGKFFKGLKGDGESTTSGLSGFIDDLKAPFKELTGVLGEMQNTLRATTLLQIAIAVGVLAASVSTLSKIDEDGLNRAVTALAILFGQLVVAMMAFQRIDIRGGMTQLILVAAALRILTSSVKEMSELDWGELAKGLTGTAALLVILAGTMRAMPSGKKLASTGVGIILLAAGVRILVEAVEPLSEMSWDELSRGLVGVGTLLASLALFTKLVSVNKMGVTQGVGLILLATALKILASAAEDFSELSWNELAKGLVGVGGGLIAIAGALKMMPAKSILSAAAILIVASSLSLIAKAVKEMGDLSWEEISKGLITMGGALIFIAGAIKLMPKHSLLSAAAIFIVAQALGAIGDAVAKMGENDWGQVGRGLAVLAGSLLAIFAALSLLPPNTLLSAAAIFIVAQALGAIATAFGTMGAMGWDEIGKGLVALAGALGIIAGAMYLMTGALPGAAALLVVAAALSVLVPVLQALGSMSIIELVTGLAALAGIFAVLGLSALVLAPLTPVIIALAAAIALLGLGLLAAGAGMLAFGMGLGAIAAAGAGAAAALAAFVTAMVELLPEIAVGIGEAIVELAVTIGEGAPKIIEAFVAIMTALLDAVVELAPAIGEAFIVLVRTLLDAVVTLTPEIIAALLVLLNELLAAIVAFVPNLVTAGMDLIIGILEGIASKIGDVVTAAVDVVVAFLEGVAKELPRLIQAGIDVVLALVNGVADGIRNNQTAMQDAGGNLAKAIVEGMVSGIGRGISAVTNAAKDLARNALNAAKDFLGIRSPSKEFEKLGKFSAEGYAKGLSGNQDKIVDAQKGLLELLATTKKAVEKDIADLNKKLATLNKNRRKNKKEIAEVTAALKESRSELAKVNAATKMAGTFNDEIERLKKLSVQLEGVTDKLAEADKKLEDATRTRDDYFNSIKDQYGRLESISKDTKLTDYTEDLQKKIVDTQIYASQLQELRKRGLNDELYKQLLGAGVEGSDFAKQLLEGGAGAISEMNSLSASLTKASTKLGTETSRALYQAGVDSAAGIVKGLQNQEAALKAEMTKLGTYMVTAIKKELGIKSPSRVFAEVGGDIISGLVRGLDKPNDVTAKVRGVGNAAVEEMRKTLSQLDGSAVGGMSLNPTIRPVLDLSAVRRDATHIQGLLAARPLDVGASSMYARSTLVELNERNDHIRRRELNPTIDGITYNQYNYSPRALSSVEIYRNTKNQLSTMKGAFEQT